MQLPRSFQHNQYFFILSHSTTFSKAIAISIKNWIMQQNFYCWKEYATTRIYHIYTAQTFSRRSSVRKVKMSYEVKKISGQYADMLDKSFGVKDSLFEFGSSGCLLPLWHQSFAQRIIDAEVREDDVWLISYPKTGDKALIRQRKWMIKLMF